MPLSIREDGKFDTGRPTLYRPEYCQDIIRFFQSHITNPDTMQARCVPTKESWLRTIKNPKTGLPISKQAFCEWVHEYPDFGDAVKTCEDIVKDILINGGLKGDFNPTAFIFTAKNLTDMRDVQETQNTLTINIADYLTQIPERTIDANYQVIDDKRE